MLSFIYDALNYDPIYTATSSTDDDPDGTLGTYTKFCQREFFPPDTNWESDENF